MKKAAGCSFSLSRSGKALPCSTAAGPLPACPRLPAGPAPNRHPGRPLRRPGPDPGSSSGSPGAGRWSDSARTAVPLRLRPVSIRQMPAPISSQPPSRGRREGTKARAARTAGAPQTSRNGMCACGSPQAGEENSCVGLFRPGSVLPYPERRSFIPFRSSPFPSSRRRLPGQRTLIRAYPARAPAPARARFAAARIARLIARARPRANRTPDTLLLSALQGVFFAPAPTRTTRRPRECRFLPAVLLYHKPLKVKHQNTKKFIWP